MVNLIRQRLIPVHIKCKHERQPTRTSHRVCLIARGLCVQHYSNFVDYKYNFNDHPFKTKEEASIAAVKQHSVHEFVVFGLTDGLVRAMRMFPDV